MLEKSRFLRLNCEFLYVIKYSLGRRFFWVFLPKLFVAPRVRIKKLHELCQPPRILSAFSQACLFTPILISPKCFPPCLYPPPPGIVVGLPGLEMGPKAEDRKSRFTTRNTIRAYFSSLIKIKGLPLPDWLPLDVNVFF